MAGTTHRPASPGSTLAKRTSPLTSSEVQRMLETASIVPVGGLASWRGADLLPADWTRGLTPVHQAEIERPLAHIRRIGLHATEFGRADFPLATLAESLARIVADVQDGRGVVLVRGLDLSHHSQEDAEII